MIRTATTVELSGAAGEVLEFVVEAEKLGLDACWEQSAVRSQDLSARLSALPIPSRVSPRAAAAALR